MTTMFCVVHSRAREYGACVCAVFVYMLVFAFIVSEPDDENYRARMNIEHRRRECMGIGKLSTLAGWLAG